MSFRFGLRSLLIGVTIVAVIAAWHVNSLSANTPRHTGRMLDLAIFGRGYLEVADYESGGNFYTRNGRLSINADGQLTSGRPVEEWVVQPPITLPTDWQDVKITTDGLVFVRTPGQTQNTQVGQLQLASFINPDGLISVGPDVFQESEESGFASLGNPGDSAFGYLHQEWLNESPLSAMQARDWTNVLIGLLAAALCWVGYELRQQRRALLRLQRRMP